MEKGLNKESKRKFMNENEKGDLANDYIRFQLNKHKISIKFHLIEGEYHKYFLGFS